MMYPKQIKADKLAKKKWEENINKKIMVSYFKKK